MTEETKTEAKPEVAQVVKEDSYKLVEVPTQMGTVIQTPKGEHIDVNEAIVSLLNEVKALKEAIIGK